jgi:hypothetical protein
MPRPRVHSMNIALDGYAGDWPDDGWRGWWGDEPPFQTPAFVMSHPRIPRLTFPTGRASGSWTGRRRRCFA